MAKNPALYSVLVLIIVSVLGGCQTTFKNSTPMLLSGETIPPRGFESFCLRHTEECDEFPSKNLILTPERFSELEDINWAVNKNIQYKSDISNYGVEEYWDYDNSKGDCEDYALEKRRRLVQAGWPRSALLITVARIPNGLGHAVLTVKTDKGDYVLDNRSKWVLPWEEVGYQWIMRESSTTAKKWRVVANTKGSVGALLAERYSGSQKFKIPVDDL